jgi:cyclic pyranopterin phosphate synthase
MVDISDKNPTHREARAAGKIYLKPETIEMIREHQIKKGEVLAVARVAAISGAKKTSELIPLCHNILINQIEVQFSLKKDYISITARAKCDGKTGIEMEAMIAVAIAALTIYDMCKAVDKEMMISEINLREKTKNEIQG